MRRLRLKNLVLAIAATAALGSGARSAFGTADPLRAYDILIDPSNPAHILVHSAWWGMLESRDEGRTWSYICSEAFGKRFAASYEVTLAAGRIVVNAWFAGLTISDDGCTWRDVPSPGEASINAVARADGTGRELLMLTEEADNGKIRAHLRRSVDRGDTWMQVGGALPSDVAEQFIAVAPSDPKRIYLTGRIIDGSFVLMASADGGSTWDLRELPPQADPDQLEPSVALIHPTRPDAVLVRMKDLALGVDPTDHLWATPDAGATWVHAYADRGDILGTAISPWSAQVLISVRPVGIFAAPFDEAFGGREDPFRPVFSGTTFGLAAAGGRLFVGTDILEGFGRGDVLSFADPSFRMAGLASYRNITLACANDASFAAKCTESWNTVSSTWAWEPPLQGAGGAPSIGAAESGAAGATSNVDEGSAGVGGSTSGSAAGGKQRDTRSRGIERASCALAPQGERATLSLVAIAALLRSLRKRARRKRARR